jgi:hypothetical protein
MNLPSDIAFEYRITGYKNGSINVSGPINDLLFFRIAMNDAERAVLSHIQQRAASPIVLPQSEIKLNGKKIHA